MNGIEKIGAINEAILNKLQDVYRYYSLVGGMPEAVARYLETGLLSEAEKTLNYILALYLADFSQYTTPAEFIRIADVWRSIPGQLAKSGSKFFLSRVSKNARSREYRPAIEWLEDAGLIRRVHRVSTVGLPLSAYEDLESFKVYLSDVGLLRALCQMPSQAIVEDNPLYREFKGAFTENYVLNCLVQQFGTRPSYLEQRGSQEVDFVLQREGLVLPVEVKAGNAVRSSSIKKYDKQYNPSLVVRFSQKNLSLDGKVLNIPLPLADWTEIFLRKVLY